MQKKKNRKNVVLFRAGGQRAPKVSLDGRRARFPDPRRRLAGFDVPGTGVPRPPVQVERPPQRRAASERSSRARGTRVRRGA